MNSRAGKSRSSRASCCGVLALLVFLATDSRAVSTNTTETSVKSEYLEPWDWGGLRLGIARVETKGQPPSSSYVLSGAGLNDQLVVGEEPLAHLKRCAAGNYPPGLFDAAAVPGNAPSVCLLSLVLFGDFLVEGPLGKRLLPEDVEIAQGWRFLEQGFLLLLTEVQGLTDEKLRLETMQVIQRLDFRVRTMLEVGLNKVPATVLKAALQYYTYVWNWLPTIPNDYDAFRLKIAAGEDIRWCYRRSSLDDVIGQRGALDALHFYGEATRFHQAPVPPAEGAHPPPTLLAYLRNGVGYDGIGYAVFPGETGLRPLTILAHSDLEESELLLKGILAAQLIDKSEWESREKSVVAENNKLKLADLKRWIGIAAQQGDRAWQTDLRVQLVQFYRDVGDQMAAEQLLEKICADLRAEGEITSWVFRTVDLITYKVVREQWQPALALIQQVKPFVIEGVVSTNLEDFLKCEYAVHEKLGLPQPDSAWLDRLGPFFAALPADNEPDLDKHVADLRAYSQKPNLPPVLAMTTAIKLASTLRDIGKAAEAEEILIRIEPEVRRWRGPTGELDRLEALLMLQAGRGNFGAFYATFNRYQALSGQLHGQNWLTVDGRRLAQIFFGLQDYHQAQSILELHQRADYWDALQNPLKWQYSWPISGESVIPSHSQDSLLAARIQLELGEKEEALRALKEADASTHGLAMAGQRNASEGEILASSKSTVLQLAEIYLSLGESQTALDRVSKVLAIADPLQDTDIWSRATILQGQLQLALGQSADKVAAKLEEIAPHAADYHELSASTAVDMDIFLGDYYGGQKSHSTATQHLQRGLALAEKSGTVDAQIIIQRKLGESAAQDNDANAAADHYRKSIALLKSISRSIPSDLGKVGYRAERNKAVPLLVMTLYELYLQSKDSKYLTEMFSVIEEGKARALAEMLMPGEGSSISDLGAIQKSLPPESLIVEYYIPEGVADRIFRLIIDRSSIAVDVVDLSGEQMRAQVETLLEKVKRPEQFDETSFKLRAKSLGSSLLPAKLMADEGARHNQTVFVVPAGVLHLFPFALLVDQEGHYLDEHSSLEIAYLPNASALARRAPRFAEVPRSAGFVNPALDEEQHETLSAAGELKGSLTKAFQIWGGGTIEWERPLSALEFLAQAPKVDNVFLYAHGRFLPDDPTGSYLRFADEGGKASFVSAAQLLVTKVGGGLWVLAACSSGVTKVQTGDEALGLPRALLVAGASMVVISLWDVDSATSLTMMTHMYESLAQGLSVAEALHRASAALRREGKLPYDWAPFILIGQQGYRRDRP